MKVGSMLERIGCARCNGGCRPAFEACTRRPSLKPSGCFRPNRIWFRAALSTLIIGVTSFFRDDFVFETLRTRILPPIVSSTPHGLSAWSVGCSDGAELYSVAMILADMGALEHCHLLGTDCRADAIKRARLGRFDATAMHTLPTQYERYAVEDSAGGVIVPKIRHSVHWRVSDVLTLQEPGVWDMILCRNMAMYLSGGAAAGLWERLAASLRPGGILVTGKAERPTGASEFTAAGPCIFRRNRG